MRTPSAFIVVLLACVACGDGGKTDVHGRPFAGSGYALDVPEGWTVQRGVMKSDLAAVVPGSEADDGFAENLNVVLENTPGGTTLEAYLDTTRGLLSNGHSARIVSEESVTLGGVPGWRLRYEMSMGGLQFDNDVLIVTKGGGAYVITLSMLKGTSRERYFPELDAVAKTFRFE